MEGSTLSLNLKKTGDILKNSAAGQIIDYKQRFQSIKDLYERFLADLIVSDFSLEEAYSFALEYFGSNKVKFAAVDGTEYTKPMFDLVIFFADACASKGYIQFQEEDNPKVEYLTGLIEEERGLCTCVPVFVNKVSEIDQTFPDLNEEIQTSMVKPLTDESIVINSSIASWMMAFAEIFLSYKLISDPEENIKILLLDRSLTCIQTSLIYDTSYRTKWEKKGALIGYNVDGYQIDEKDLTLGRHRISNKVLGLPPPRGDYLKYAIIYLLEKETQPLTTDEICEKLSITQEDRRRRVKHLLKKAVRAGYIEAQVKGYSIAQKYKDSWNKIKQLVKTLGAQLLEGNNDQNPLKISKGGEEHWLTTLDIAFLTLFCFYMLLEECWKNRVLLLGITKDTASRDFKNQVVPVCVNNHIWKQIDQEKLSQAPNTDRMLLQSISLFNYDTMKVPWSLIEYDSAFRTIVPDFKKRKGYVSGARKNKIIPERLFLKTYIQLTQANYDPQLRSNVLFIDRLVYPEYDLHNISTLSFRHEYAATEPVNLIFYKNKDVENKIQNLIMVMLKAMSSSSIPEVFGHNKPLFIADKVAKWHYKEALKVINSAKKWIVNNRDLRKFIFYMSTFRERRGQVEAARREI